MDGNNLFFKEDQIENCHHTTYLECKNQECWYANHLTDECLSALHDKNQHGSCKGEYIIGYTFLNSTVIFADCECLCHQNKYYSPFVGRWI